MKEKILDLLLNTTEFVSGQEISDRFGVSRTAVWKAIRQLESEGYEIEAVRNRGYRLQSKPDRVSAGSIRENLHTQWAGSEICCLASVDSTNNEAKRMAENGSGHGLLVLADEQSSGRGRRGREWKGKPGEGIAMSLLLKPDIEPGNASMLTLVMGLAVREAIEEVTRVKAQIKWPNDIVYDGRKICGILTEMSAQIDYINHIVIGAGINVHQELFPEGIKNVAVSLYQITGVHFDRSALIAAVMNHFETYYSVYSKSQDLRGLRDLYNSHLINADRIVQVIDGDRSFRGTARGIDPRGELLVEKDGQIVTVSAGEVSVRGVYGYV